MQSLVNIAKLDSPQRHRERNAAPLRHAPRWKPQNVLPVPDQRRDQGSVAPPVQAKVPQRGNLELFLISCIPGARMSGEEFHSPTFTPFPDMNSIAEHPELDHETRTAVEHPGHPAELCRSKW